MKSFLAILAVCAVSAAFATDLATRQLVVDVMNTEAVFGVRYSLSGDDNRTLAISYEQSSTLARAEADVYFNRSDCGSMLKDIGSLDDLSVLYDQHGQCRRETGRGRQFFRHLLAQERDVGVHAQRHVRVRRGTRGC